MERLDTSPLAQVVHALTRMQKKDAAVALLHAFSDSADTYEQFDEVAFLYNKCKEYSHAAATLEACLALGLTPHQYYSIRANLAKVLNYLNDPLQSLTYSYANQSVIPDDKETQLEIGFSFYLLGNYAKSKEIMLELIADPTLPLPLRERAQYNMGTYKMDDGEFVEGLHDLVTLSHKTGIVPVKELPHIPKWTGLPVEGQTLIILAEGGLGDELIGVRFMQHVIELGMEPIWVTNHVQLKTVLLRHGYACTTDPHLIEPTNTVYCQAFFLPLLLQLDETEVWRGPYITPDPSYVEKWKSLLPEGKKIAVKWYGNKEYDQDLHRSIPPALINSLGAYGQLISVQLEGIAADDMTVNALDVGSTIIHLEDTLAILSLCDVTVSSCTSVAHMAGALGVPAIICPPIATYYCWLGRHDDRSHWYGDALRVFRQSNHNNWDAVFEKIHTFFKE